MTTQTEPTEAAKRAAWKILGITDPQYTSVYCGDGKALANLVTIIDRETGLPELIEAIRPFAGIEEDNPGEAVRIYVRWSDVLKARAALKKAGEA